MSATGVLLQQRYEIVRLIAQGGMGAVYQGRDWRLGGSLVALKQSLFMNEQMRSVFEREANLLARLSHPGLPKVRDLFTEENGQYIVMEFVPGYDLEDTLQQHRQPIQPTTVLTWADQILDALEYLHSAQPPVIHRDIKPNNLKLTPQGHVMLLDFGLSKGETASFSIHGYTSAYAPIEQIRNSGTDARSDIYALGATLFRLLTNTLPENAITRLEALALGRPDPQRLAHEINPEVPLLVSHVLSRAMQLNRDARFHNARELRLSLRSAVQIAPPTPQPNFDTTVPTPPTQGTFPPNPFYGGQSTGGAANSGGQPFSGYAAPPTQLSQNAPPDPHAQKTVNEEQFRRSDPYGTSLPQPPVARPTQPLPPAQPSNWPAQRPAQPPPNARLGPSPSQPPPTARPAAPVRQPSPSATVPLPPPTFNTPEPQNPISVPPQELVAYPVTPPVDPALPIRSGTQQSTNPVHPQITLTPAITPPSTPWLKYLLTSCLLVAFGAGCVLLGQKFMSGEGAVTPKPADTSTAPFTNQLGLTFQYIPAGTFEMGSTAESDSQPLHTVTLPTPFYLSKFETTQAQWQQLLKNNPSRFTGTDLPVENVSFNDVQKFIAALNQLNDDYQYRLPSEAEWEYAARAGQPNASYADLGALAWYKENTTFTQPVGKKQANAFGLHDMLGNVAEWCADGWHENYRGAPVDGSGWNATGVNKGMRVVRGESWYSPANQCTPAYRNYEELVKPGAALGFRVAATRRNSAAATSKPATP